MSARSPSIRDFERALTLWQPWASAIAEGTKRIENRPKAPPQQLIGKFFWIHAGLHYHHMAHQRVARLWPALIVRKSRLPLGAIIACAKLVGFVRASEDPWFIGPYGYVLENVSALVEPVPCRGFQGAWIVPAATRELALARLAA